MKLNSFLTAGKGEEKESREDDGNAGPLAGGGALGKDEKGKGDRPNGAGGADGGGDGEG